MSKFKDDFPELGMGKKKTASAVRQWLEDFQRTGDADEADRLSKEREKATEKK